MMEGINFEGTVALADAVSLPIIASGGVNQLSDIAQLAALPARDSGGVQGVITGRAIYEGTLDLKAAFALTAGR